MNEFLLTRKRKKKEGTPQRSSLEIGTSSEQFPQKWWNHKGKKKQKKAKKKKITRGVKKQIFVPIEPVFCLLYTHTLRYVCIYGQ